MLTRTHTWHILKTADYTHSTLPDANAMLAYLLLQIPYVNSTKAKDRFRHRKKNRFLEVLSARIDLQKNHTTV